MAVRKKRPVLYEVIRPEHHRGAPAQPSIAQQPVRPPKSEPGRPLLSPRTTPTLEDGEETVTSGRVFNVPMSTLTVVAAFVIMALFVAFMAGKQYGAKSQGASPELIPTDIMSMPEEEPSKEPEIRREETNRSDSRASEPAPGENLGLTKPKDPEPAQPPTVTLQKGYTYIIVQHFSKNKRGDAEAASEFLRGQGVNTALLVGNDISLVATESFLIEQRDAAAAERERRRLVQLQQRIKELGRQYDKELRARNLPSYTFSECYPRLMR